MAYLNQLGKLPLWFILFRLKQSIYVHGVKDAHTIRDGTISFTPLSGMPLPKDRGGRSSGAAIVGVDGLIGYCGVEGSITSRKNSEHNTGNLMNILGYSTIDIK